MGRTLHLPSRDTHSLTGPVLRGADMFVGCCSSSACCNCARGTSRAATRLTALRLPTLPSSACPLRSQCARSGLCESGLCGSAAGLWNEQCENKSVPTGMRIPEAHLALVCFRLDGHVPVSALRVLSNVWTLLPEKAGACVMSKAGMRTERAKNCRTKEKGQKSPGTS